MCPEPQWFRNHSSAQLKSKFVDNVLGGGGGGLLELACIKEIHKNEVIVSSPLGVVDNVLWEKA